MKLINADLLTVNKGLILHGVNCLGVMGSGVALALKRKYPVIEKRYKDLCLINQSSPEKIAGSIDSYWIHRDLIVANGFTQFLIGKDTNNPFESAAAWPHLVYSVLESAVELAVSYDYKINTVKIGCERGGLPWPLVQSMMLGIERCYGEEFFNVYYI